jgi:prevent-host-death family protein
LLRYSISDAKKLLPRLVREVEAGDTVTLTRHGKPVAVVVSIEEYGRLQSVEPISPWQALLRARECLSSADAAAEHAEDVFEDVRDRSVGREPQCS